MKITKIFKSDKDKNGNPFKTKDGRTYTRMAIKLDSFGDEFISGFASNWNAFWKEGDELVVGRDIEIKEVAKEGKIYKNFERVDRLVVIEKRLEKVEAWIKAEIAKKPKEPTIKYPKEVEAEEDILNNLQF